MSKLILVTGANGYIAGRLIPRLLARGYRLRCLVRDPSRLIGRSWAASVEIVRADLLRLETLGEVLEGVQAAYYLVHSMSSGRHYPELDLRAARNFVAAACYAGLDQVIYLGGLADPDGPITPHMRSRIETGEALREGCVPVTEFRAGVIIGPGSISFEMIRYLSEQIPILPGPTWLRNLSQPIAAEDVFSYLIEALETSASLGEVIEIGGADVLTHAESMLLYARQRGLNRRLFTLPFIPIRFMAWIVGNLTPVPAAIARPLIGGLQAPSIIRHESAQRIFPHLHPQDYPTALAGALAGLTPSAIEPHLIPLRHALSLKQEGFLLDVRQATVKTAPEVIYAVLTSLGGRKGWLYADWLWRLRGWIDRLLGGPGMRGRSDSLRVGDALDFYRVEILHPGDSLRLQAELKAPGEGWMEWRLLPEGVSTRIVQIAWFAPRGLPGFLYWHLLGPIHRLVFAGLLRRITALSLRRPQVEG